MKRIHTRVKDLLHDETNVLTFWYSQLGKQNSSKDCCFSFASTKHHHIKSLPYHLCSQRTQCPIRVPKQKQDHELSSTRRLLLLEERSNTHSGSSCGMLTRSNCAVLNHRLPLSMSHTHTPTHKKLF